MTSMIRRQLEAMDLLASGIQTPTITREEAEKWGMLDSEFYRWSCLVREIARRPLEKRREWLAEIERRHGQGEELEAARAALRFEFEQLRGNR